MTTIFDAAVSTTDEAITALAEAKRKAQDTERVLLEAQEAFAVAKLHEREAADALAEEMRQRVDFAFGEMDGPTAS